MKLNVSLGYSDVCFRDDNRFIASVAHYVLLCGSSVPVCVQCICARLCTKVDGSTRSCLEHLCKNFTRVLNEDLDTDCLIYFVCMRRHE